MLRKKLRHSNETRIGQRDREILVLPHQLQDKFLVEGNIKGYFDNPVLEEPV